MPIHSRMKCLLATLLVAFVISGCQSSNNKWTTAWKERTKPKPQFQGLEGSEEVTYWPYKPSKDKKKMTAIPSQLKEKLARNSEQSKSTKQQTELIKEGDQLRKNGQYEDARLVYSKALLLSPESPEVNHRLAIIADKQHHYSTADQYYQAALRVRPQDVNLLSDLGYSYSLRGNALQAEQTLKDALVIDKTHKGAMLNLGSLYSQQNRYPEALEMFRSGATEAEAQQYIAKLFPQGRAVGDSVVMADRTIADRGNSTASLAIGSAPPDSAPDISKMSFEQIQTEMARRKQDAKLRRQQEAQQEHLRIQNLASETERFEQLQAQQQRLAQLNPRGGTAGGPMTLGPQSGSDPVYSKNQPGGEMSQRQTEMLLPGSNSQAQVMNVPFGAPSNNATPQDRSLRSAQGAGAPSNTEFFLGSPGQTQPQRQTDSQIQQAWGQRLGTATNNDQQINGSNPASQMATQLGMSAGPGNMFPIMLGSHATSSVNDGAIPAGLSNSQASGFGGGFAQPSNSPNSQSWSGNQVEPPSNATQKNDGFDSIAPLSPASNWGPLTTGASNWQNGSSNSSSWSNETQNASGVGTAIESAGGSQTGSGQNQNRKMDGFVTIPSDLNSSTGTRTGHDGSRPYNGAWPNSNALPTRQNQNPSAIGRSPESLELMSINPRNGMGGESSSNSNGAMSNPSGGSTPQWPYAPNR